LWIYDAQGSFPIAGTSLLADRLPILCRQGFVGQLGEQLRARRDGMADKAAGYVTFVIIRPDNLRKVLM
jgi:hypothetical protein